VGWAGFGTEGDSIDELLLAADRAMYANKTRRKASGLISPHSERSDGIRVM
jgi:hypothetical protein